MFEICSAAEGRFVSPLDSWEYILNPRPSGRTEHAGRGEATDGTSIPRPGCEFMFSRLWISLHIRLFGRLARGLMWPSFVCNLRFWLSSWDSNINSFQNVRNARLAASERLYSKTLERERERARRNTRVPLVYLSQRPTLFLSASPCLAHFCGGKPEGFTALPSSINQH